MLAYVAGVLGVFLGIRRAKQRGGNRLDMAQYGIGFGLAFFLIAYFLLLVLSFLL